MEVNTFSDPLTPVDCDLRDFAFMPLDVVRLRDSDLVSLETAESFRAAVMLWCASWHQLPAGSLPDDDRVLANLAGYGRVVKEWLKDKPGAMRGWIKCSDGRLYHPVVSEKAKEAWASKLERQWRTECARIKKHAQRHGIEADVPEFESWLSSGRPQGHAINVPKDKGNVSPRTPPDCPGSVPGENASKGQGEGQGQGQGQYSVTTDVVTAGDAGKSAAEMTKDELWKAGKSLLSDAGMPASQCGSFVGKLVKDYGDAIVVDAVRSTVVARPADPAEYLKAVCMRARGERKTPNRQEAIEQRNSSVADQWTQGATHETV